MTADDVRAKLREATKAAGSVKSWAIAHGVPAPVANTVLHGREPTPQLVAALGLRRVVSYEPVAKGSRTPHVSRASKAP
jgi:hypothetical protein